MTKPDSSSHRATDFSIAASEAKELAPPGSSVQGRPVPPVSPVSRKATIVWSVIYIVWTAYLIYVITQLS